MRIRIWIGAIAALSAAWAAPGSAATCSDPAPTSYTLNAASKAQCFTGKDTNQIDADFSMFDKTGWVLAEKNDGLDGDGVITFVDAPSNGAKSGDWAINTLAGLDHIVITLKAGNGFGAFLLDLTVTDPLTGDWESGKDLSHASIYCNGAPTTPIPLPAAAWMLLAGLAGLGGLARRRSA